MTGALSSVDAPALNGAKLVKVEEINAAGGVLGKKLELATYDTKTDPTVMASVASQLVNQDKVVAGAGYANSDSVLALGPIFQQAGIPFVTPGAAWPTYRSDRQRHLPRLLGDDVAGSGGRRIRSE